MTPWTGQQLQLIESSQELVRRIAGLVTHPQCVTFDDLVSAGQFGLLAAARKFDPTRRVRFATFASRHIRGAMLDYLRECDWVPRLERTRHKAGRVKDLRSLVSLDAEHDEFSLGQIVAGRPVQCSAEDAEQVERLLRGLRPDQRAVLWGRYVAELTLAQIGRRLGLSEARCSQICTEALAEARAKLRATP